MEMLCKTPFSNICQDPVPQYLLTLRVPKIVRKDGYCHYFFCKFAMFKPMKYYFQAHHKLNKIINVKQQKRYGFKGMYMAKDGVRRRI